MLSSKEKSQYYICNWEFPVRLSPVCALTARSSSCMWLHFFAAPREHSLHRSWRNPQPRVPLISDKGQPVEQKVWSEMLPPVIPHFLFLTLKWFTLSFRARLHHSRHSFHFSSVAYLYFIPRIDQLQPGLPAFSVKWSRDGEGQAGC